MAYLAGRHELDAVMPSYLVGAGSRKMISGLLFLQWSWTRSVSLEPLRRAVGVWLTG